MNGATGLLVVTVAYDGARLITTGLVPTEAHALGLSPWTHRSIVVEPELGSGPLDARIIEGQVQRVVGHLCARIEVAWGQRVLF